MIFRPFTKLFLIRNFKTGAQLSSGTLSFTKKKSQGRPRRTLFFKEQSDLKSKYTEDDIINMLEFLVDNIFVVFGGKIFQQIVGIPMETNCAPLS